MFYMYNSLVAFKIPPFLQAEASFLRYSASARRKNSPPPSLKRQSRWRIQERGLWGGGEAPPTPTYFKTKLRPEGPKPIFFFCIPPPPPAPPIPGSGWLSSPLSEGLDLSLNPTVFFFLLSILLKKDLEPFFKFFDTFFYKNFPGKIADKYMENLKQASGEIWSQ